jgi:hypothetical protein
MTRKHNWQKIGKRLFLIALIVTIAAWIANSIIFYKQISLDGLDTNWNLYQFYYKMSWATRIIRNVGIDFMALGIGVMLFYTMKRSSKKLVGILIMLSGLAIGSIWGIYTAFVYLTESIPIARYPLRYISISILCRWAIALILFGVGMVAIASSENRGKFEGLKEKKWKNWFIICAIIAIVGLTIFSFFYYEFQCTIYGHHIENIDFYSDMITIGDLMERIGIALAAFFIGMIILSIADRINYWKSMCAMILGLAIVIGIEILLTIVGLTHFKLYRYNHFIFILLYSLPFLGMILLLLGVGTAVIALTRKSELLTCKSIQ